VFMDSLYNTGNDLMASSVLKHSGKSPIMVAISLASKSSVEPAAVVPPSFEHSNSEFSNKFVSFMSFVISALGWKPNTSGDVLMGRPLIKSMNSSCPSQSGKRYKGSGANL